MDYTDILKRLNKIYTPGEARALMMMVLEQRFGMSTTDVYTGKVTNLSPNDLQELEKIIQLLEKQVPVQYILGQADFCGHTFKVTPDVLIPRPETEELVELVQCGMRNVKCEMRSHILDIGTGSGCIAISLKLACHDAHVEGWDISEGALKIAKENAETLGADVTFRKIDILSSQDILRNSPSGGWGLLVSNPPYICNSEAKDMDKNVLDHEPHLALFVPDDAPLLFYRAIAEKGLKLLKPNGLLFFEINRAYGKATAGMLSSLGYTNIEILKDQFGNDRMIKCINTKNTKTQRKPYD